MPSVSNSSAPSSAPTSRSAPASPPSEADFLAKQANDAKAAMARITQEITRDLAGTVDPRGWVRVAPWTTLAAAAVAGFAATAMIVPSKEQQALHRLRKIEEALDSSGSRRGRNGRHDDDDDEDRDDEDGKGSFVTSLLGHAFHLLQPMLSTAVTAVLSARAAVPPAPSPDAQTSEVPPPTDL